MLRSPLILELLMHFYVTPTPHPRADAPAVIDGTEMLMNSGMIQKSIHDGYETTEKAKAHIECILKMPFPQKKWVTYIEQVVPE